VLRVALLQRTHPLAALVEEAEKCHKSVLIAQHFQINKTASSPSEIFTVLWQNLVQQDASKKDITVVSTAMCTSEII